MILNRLIGDECQFPFEHRLLNIVLVFGTIISFWSALTNYMLDLGASLVITCIISGIILGVLYYLSIVKKLYRFTLSLVTFLAIFIIIPMVWIYNGGTFGTIPLYIALFSSIGATLFSGFRRIAIMICLIVMCNILLMLEYQYPLLITSYSNDIVRYIDISIGLTTTIIVNTLLFVIVINYYNKEHEKVIYYLTKVEKQKRDMEFQNHLKMMNERLQEEIGERKQVERQLRDKNEQLKHEIAERIRTEKEMARLDRLNLIGQMAASIGHEVRNPMTTVKGYLQYFGRKSQFSMYADEFNIMINELDRTNEIITEFLALAKNKSISLTQTCLNHSIKAIYPLLEANAIEKGHNLELELGKIDELLLDEKDIRQLILNLVYNGFEAIAERGTVIIKTYQEGDRVVLVVQDNGCGISQEVLRQIGTPFVTTKEKGTGLGLAVCYRIAERHKAKLEVETSCKGTAFFIKFNAPQSA